MIVSIRSFMAPWRTVLTYIVLAGIATLLASAPRNNPDYLSSKIAARAFNT
jgi:hypothetical protein